MIKEFVDQFRGMPHEKKSHDFAYDKCCDHPDIRTIVHMYMAKSTRH
jgi:hypothetical protein